MLSEGWDANTVTHVLGVRAFGTQLLCEQVVGRALRRQSYELNAEGLFDAEYADILGIPFRPSSSSTRTTRTGRTASSSATACR
jgi:type III restriction enzyme